MPEIIFNIVSGKLSGTIDSYSFDVYAYSGGRGGSKKKGAAHPIIVNNPFFTRMKLKGHKETDYAGPLPMGLYTLEKHKSKPNWIRLIPSTNNVMFNRDGFAIHGKGQRGSDGCIVPNDFDIVLKLCEKCIEREKKGLPIILEVKAVGDIDYFETMIKKYNSIG
jgi:hypothetical protein